MNDTVLIEEFYSKPFYMSYSGLNKILFSPAVFYNHYILKKKEDKVESYLIDGRIIHCLLLDNGSFDDQFILIPDSLPGDSVRGIVDKLYSKVQEGSGFLKDYTVEILEILKEVNLHQSLKTDVQRLEKVINSNTESYFEFLKCRNGKELLDSETLRRCNESVTVLRNHPSASELLGLFASEFDNIEIYNEMKLSAETDKPFGLKGILDNLKIDHDNKVIYINDLKTTGKTLTEFPESVEFYNYWAQAAIYERLVWYNFNDLLFNKQYKLIFNFVVIDKFLQVYPFRVSAETMTKWQLRLESKLKEAEWHYTNRNYNLPYKFAKENVIL